MEWTTADIMTMLYIVVAAMLIVVLYHVLFIVVDLRKTMKRVDRVAESVETVSLKPLSMVDKGFDWVLQLLNDSGNDKHKHHAHHEHHKKS